MPIDPNRETWKPGMPWEKALEDIEYANTTTTRRMYNCTTVLIITSIGNKLGLNSS